MIYHNYPDHNHTYGYNWNWPINVQRIYLVNWPLEKSCHSFDPPSWRAYPMGGLAAWRSDVCLGTPLKRFIAKSPKGHMFIGFVPQIAKLGAVSPISSFFCFFETSIVHVEYKPTELGRPILQNIMVFTMKNIGGSCSFSHQSNEDWKRPIPLPIWNDYSSYHS